MPPQTESGKTDHRALVILLRVAGAITCTAIIASVMPTTWIEATHRWAGLGDFPDAPIARYLARSVSAMYAIVGALTVLVSTDVRRYSPIIMLLAYTTLAFGFLMIGVDVTAGMPMSWTLGEGPLALIIGVVILVLGRRVEPYDA